MDDPRQSIISPEDSTSSSDDEFFDANTSSSEEVSKSSQVNLPGPQGNDEPIIEVTATTCIPSKDIKTGQSVEIKKPNEAEPSTSTAETTGMFATPKPPPRRNRGRNNSIKCTQPQTSTLEQEVSHASSTEVSFVQTPLVSTSKPKGVTPLITDDIASIQGDLSVNEALLMGDKKSICVDDLSCEKTTASVDHGREIFNSSRFKYDEDEPSFVRRDVLSESTDGQVTLVEDEHHSSDVQSSEQSSRKTSICSQQHVSQTSTPLKEQDDDKTALENNTTVESYSSSTPTTRSTTTVPLTTVTSPTETTEFLELQDVMIKNMDTGESHPLSAAEDIVGKCITINPLSLHLMKITNDYNSDAEDTDAGTSSIEGKDKDSVEGDDKEEGSSSLSRRAGKQMKTKLKGGLKKVGRVGKTMIAGAKQTVEVVRERHSRLKDHTLHHPEHPLGHSDNLLISSHHQFRLKINRKTPADFEGLKVVEELHDCRGAVWCMKWSVDGQLLAVAGQDQLLRVYCSSKAWKYFTQLRNKASGQQTSPASTKDRSFSASRSNSMSSCDNLSMDSAFSPNASRLWSEDNTLSEEGPLLLFSAYRGHTADVLDISWSKNHFLLSSSMDKTVRLWHVTRVECLCTLRHADFVTTISFHPKDDRYFLSGSLDGKLRLWNIPDKRVTLWNEVSAGSSQPLSGSSSSTAKDTDSSQSHGLITASAFVQNGKFAVIGTYDGRVIFYSTDQLKYFTQLHVSAKGVISTALSGDPIASIDSKGRRSRRRRSNKVTGIESVDDNKILVTTNDSRLRLYDLRDLSLVCKYKGCVNVSSQIRASVSHDNKYIVCGSENSSFYIWRLQESTAIGQRKDKNSQWESVRILPQLPASGVTDTATGTAAGVKSSNPGIITAATFASAPKYLDEDATYVIAAADFTGCIRLFSK